MPLNNSGWGGLSLITQSDKFLRTVKRGAGCQSQNILAFAALAQLAEQLICNQQVVGSTPTGGFCIIYIY